MWSPSTGASQDPYVPGQMLEELGEMAGKVSREA